TSPTYLTTKTISNIVSGLELDANTSYYWRVDAIDSLKFNITKGVVWQFTTGDTELPTGGINNGGPPEKPSILTANSVSMSEIELHWSDTYNELGFTIERKVEDGAYEELANLPANTTSYLDQGLSAYTTYVYRIYAYNNDGASDYSNEASATTNKTLTYGPTEDTYVKGGYSENINYGSSLELKTKNSGLESTHRRTLLKFDLRNEILGSEEIALAKLRLYAYRATDCTISASEIDDNWNERVVTWATAPVSGDTIATTMISSPDTYYEWSVTTYVKAQLSIDSVISICVEDLTLAGDNIEFNSREAGSNRPVLVITSIGDITSIYSESILKKLSISVFPNPVNTILNIEISDEVSLLKIVSHDGRVVYSQSDVTNDLQIDVSHLLSGLYLIVADNYVGKFVKI
ncbi:MAG: DNRLRE domain-containing protein, partial [Bacteroidales bacterium]|nr:DNRLRE domain-containing protein [Bacteroidales bacterium]